MKRRILSMFCVLLTIASFFGGTTITAEASTGGSYTIWKECSSVDELEAYLGKENKCGPGSTSEEYWKSIKIISRGNNTTGDSTTCHDECNLTDGSYYEFRLSDNNLEGDYLLSHCFVLHKLAKTDWSEACTIIEPNHYYSNWYVFKTNWFSSNDTKTLNNKYLITSSSVANDQYTTKIRATSAEAVDFTRTVSKYDALHINVEYSVKFTNRTTFQFDWSFMDEYKRFTMLSCWNVYREETPYFGMNTATIGGHTYFNLVGQDQSDGGLYTDYHINANGVTTILSEYQDPFPASDLHMSVWEWSNQIQNDVSTNSNYFMIYLPIEGNVCNMVAATIDNTSVNWVENWDWKKYYESTKVKDLSYYREVSNTVTLSSGTTVFTGDSYIKPGATLVIPEGATLIIGSDSVLLIDGLVKNNGTLIIESGATVSYLSHDIEANQSMYEVVDVTGRGVSYERYRDSLRGVYYRWHDIDMISYTGIGSKGKATGLDKANTSVISAGLYPWAVMCNGIDNKGSFVVRKNAKVDIPRFTQSNDGKTWLYGTMTVEEMLYNGKTITSIAYGIADTIEHWRGVTETKFSINVSKGIENADYSLNIDGGKLYVCQNCTIKDGSTSLDNHIGLWMLSGSYWDKALTINEDVWSDELTDSSVADTGSYPIAAILGDGINIYPGDTSESLWEAVIVPDQMKDNFVN